jgi:hypothetical protein
MVVWLLDSSNPWLDCHELLSFLNSLLLKKECITFWLIAAKFKILNLSGYLILTLSHSLLLLLLKRRIFFEGILHTVHA